MYTRMLFVSHNPDMLKELQQSLTQQRIAWDMAFVRSGQEALELMERDPYAIIVTDLQMPGMNGAELLTRMQQRYPSVLRFVLAAPAALTMARSSIRAHQFINYPCDPATICSVVERSLALRNCLADEQLKSLVAKISVLPSLPDLYLRIMSELRSPDYSLASVGKIIGTDVAMSAKVLTLVNSAYFYLPQHVANPVLAVSLLGVDVIKSMILLSEVFTQFDRIRALAPRFDFVAQQQHSLRVANYARAIAKYEHLDQETSDAFFTAGLFHDIGKLMLVANMPQQCEEIIKLEQHDAMDPTAAERAVLGATHAEVGAYLLGQWDFQYPIIEACAYHHVPERAVDTGVNTVTVIHAANIFAHQPTDTDAPPADTDEAPDERLAAWQRSCREMDTVPQ